MDWLMVIITNIKPFTHISHSKSFLIGFHSHNCFFFLLLLLHSSIIGWRFFFGFRFLSFFYFFFFFFSNTLWLTKMSNKYTQCFHFDGFTMRELCMYGCEPFVCAVAVIHFIYDKKITIWKIFIGTIFIWFFLNFLAFKSSWLFLQNGAIV